MFDYNTRMRIERIVEYDCTQGEYTFTVLQIIARVTFRVFGTRSECCPRFSTDRIRQDAETPESYSISMKSAIDFCAVPNPIYQIRRNRSAAHTVHDTKQTRRRLDVILYFSCNADGLNFFRIFFLYIIYQFTNLLFIKLYIDIARRVQDECGGPVILLCVLFVLFR